MKKIVSFILCLLMLVPMLSSCSDKEDLDTIETTTRSAVTLSLYVITENGTTEAAADAVEDAIRSLVKSKYTTNLEIEYISEYEYYDRLEAQLGAMENAKNAVPVETEVETGDESGDETGEATAEVAETEAATTEATVVNEYGVTELRYPELTEGQVDIFMITNYDKYLEYVDKNWLYNLDNAVKTSSNKLTDYIYPSIFEAAKVNGSYYAIPNNMPIGGNGTYMIIDRELASEYGLDVKRVSSLFDSELVKFINWVSENKPGVTPVAGKYEELNVTYMNYLGRAFNNRFSLVGAYGSDVITDAENLFVNKQYVSDLLSLANLKFSNAFGDSFVENFAVSVKTGDIYDMASYSEKYEIVALESPSKSADQLAKNMFAVSAFTKDIDRVMEVLTLLNTNSELRNLLQYGIKNVHYELDETTGALSRMNNEYMMDIYKTGNVYMAYPEEGMPLNIWEMAKKQNLVSRAKVDDSFSGFVIPDDIEEEVDPETGDVISEAFKVDLAPAEALSDASKELKAALDSAATYDEYAAIVNGAAEKYAAVIEAFLDTSAPNTPYALYKAQ